MREVAGFGVGLRTAFVEEIVGIGERAPDWLEVTPENWVCHGGRRRRNLDACIERYAVVPHSVSLSLGGPDPLDAGFLASIDALCRRTGAPWWSDHLCYSSLRGAPLHDLLPLPFTDEAADHAAARADETMRRVEAPLLLENATFYSHMPGATMDEAAFLVAVLERCRAGLLLDVNNIYVSAINHGFDPLRYLDAIPARAVQEMHLAGFDRNGLCLIDTHGKPVAGPVWNLYGEALTRVGPVPTLIEWDTDLPSLAVLLEEAGKAQEILDLWAAPELADAIAA